MRNRMHVGVGGRKHEVGDKRLCRVYLLPNVRELMVYDYFLVAFLSDN